MKLNQYCSEQCSYCSHIVRIPTGILFLASSKPPPPFLVSALFNWFSLSVSLLILLQSRPISHTTPCWYLTSAVLCLVTLFSNCFLYVGEVRLPSPPGIQQISSLAGDKVLTCDYLSKDVIVPASGVVEGVKRPTVDMASDSLWPSEPLMAQCPLKVALSTVLYQ